MRAETRAERCARTERIEPSFISGESPVYTQAALDAGVQGPVRAKCWISAEGIPVKCALIDRVESMSIAVDRALQTYRYQPALIDGVPTMVEYEVTVQLKPPPPGWSPPTPDPVKVDPSLMGIERPHLIAGKRPVIPAEARSSCVDGMVLARCVLTKQGILRSCRILASSSPLLSKAVSDILPSYRYTPVTFKGKPVDTEYTIPFLFKPDP